MKYIIIGGVAGGATAAARLRRVDEKSDILLFEKGKYISYANCGLPYYIGGVIAEREKLLVQTPTSFGQRFRVDVRVENEVIAIHPKDKTITVRTADGHEYEETYDKLLLSPGATPVRPPLEGIDSEGIFTLRNVEDTDHIKSYLTENSVKRAVVVGAGFIGLEMAENLHHAGVAVSVVEMGNQVMAPIDFFDGCACSSTFDTERCVALSGRRSNSFPAYRTRYYRLFEKWKNDSGRYGIAFYRSAPCNGFG